MTDARFIIAVLCGLVVGLVLVLAIVIIRAERKVDRLNRHYASDNAKARELVEKLIDDRDAAAERARNYAIALGGTRRELVEANAILDVAYVRGDRGYFRRFRPQQVAA